MLVHDGRVLTETTLILEYLDAVFPDPPLTPATAADRYRMHVWTKFADEYFAPALCLIGWHERMATLMGQRDVAALCARARLLPPDRQSVLNAALTGAFTDEQLKRARTSLQVVARRLEDALSRRRGWRGMRYSLADIAIFPMAMSLECLSSAAVQETATPHLVSWLQRIRTRAGVRAALAMARTPVRRACSLPVRSWRDGDDLRHRNARRLGLRPCGTRTISAAKSRPRPGFR